MAQHDDELKRLRQRLRRVQERRQELRHWADLCVKYRTAWRVRAQQRLYDQFPFQWEPPTDEELAEVADVDPEATYLELQELAVDLFDILYPDGVPNLHGLPLLSRVVAKDLPKADDWLVEKIERAETANMLLRREEKEALEALEQEARQHDEAMATAPVEHGPLAGWTDPQPVAILADWFGCDWKTMKRRLKEWEKEREARRFGTRWQIGVDNLPIEIKQKLGIIKPLDSV